MIDNEIFNKMRECAIDGYEIRIESDSKNPGWFYVNITGDDWKRVYGRVVSEDDMVHFSDGIDQMIDQYKKMN